MIDSKPNQSLDRRLAEELAADMKEGKNSDIGDDDRKRSRSEDRSSEFDADKKKKDEEKPAPKVQDKSKPVSSTPVPGTPWYVVTCVQHIMYKGPFILTVLLLQVCCLDWRRTSILLQSVCSRFSMGTTRRVVRSFGRYENDLITASGCIGLEERKS